MAILMVKAEQSDYDYAANTLVATYWYAQAAKAQDAGNEAKFQAFYNRGRMYDRIAGEYGLTQAGSTIYTNTYHAWREGGKQAIHVRYRYEMLTGRNFLTGRMR